MENASKALIIAGSILVSILIISLGIVIYQRSSSTVNKANLNSQEAMAQNSPFEAYFRSRVSAQQVKELCSMVRSNNLTAQTGSEEKNIYLVFKTIDSSGKAVVDTTNTSKTEGIAPAKLSSLVKSEKTYLVEVANDKAYNPNSTKGTDNPDFQSGDAPAYYQSGYIRTITITENKN